MALPRKTSRTIVVDDVKYRWLVTYRESELRVTVELEESPGQLLQAIFSPHDVLIRDEGKRWCFVRQGRSIQPSHVKKIIAHGLKNGWNPYKPRGETTYVNMWQTDELCPVDVDVRDNGELLARDLAADQIADLQFDLSLDPEWRARLFKATVGERHEIPGDYFALRSECRDADLRFAVFNDGWTDYGFVVFGIQSLDFPELIAYTTNNSAII